MYRSNFYTVSSLCMYRLTHCFSLIVLKNLILGNMAAFDMSDKKSIVSPGGVGFDINCGVRLLRTNLHEKDVVPIKVNYF